MLAESRNLIDGKLADSQSGRVFETVNPATEQVLGVVADADSADLDQAIGAARRAFDESRWSGDLSFRLRCLRQLHSAMSSHSEELRDLTVAEVGSPVSLTRSAQLDDPIKSIAWIADAAESYEWERDLGEASPLGINSRRWLVREPVGVVGAITPWNVPHQINLAKIGPALAAGNTVVLKPAPDSPWCATSIGRLVAEETDIPAGVLNIVASSDHSLGVQLVSDSRVDMISFTGSTATGKAVMRGAADTVKKVFLELGGKSAFVILDDADIEMASLVAAYTVCTHAGQGCAITTRLLAPKEIFGDVVSKVAQVMNKLPAGDPTDPRTVCGPLISNKQRERVEKYLAIASQQGGTFVVGGSRPDYPDKGFYIQPTLITGIGNDSVVSQQEIFGPVLVALQFDGEDQALSLADATDYGLSASVWSSDRDRAMNFAKRLRTGTVSVNGGIWYSPDVPFGGYKQSGIGREMGTMGFEEYLEAKSIAEPA